MKEDTPLRAIVIEDVDGQPHAALRTLGVKDLPDNDVLIDVAYSSLNYKDGLAVSGKGRIARRLPMVAGIDLVGTVAESRSPQWKAGDAVLVTGWGLSETQWGGYATRVRMKPEWLVRLPQGLTAVQAMAVGTAGFTAMLCVMALQDAGIAPDGREVLVTGAAGGVGSVAVSLLSTLGYRVTASTGRTEAHAYLCELGASGFIGRDELAKPGNPFQKERWAAAVDSVGSTTLASVIAQTAYGGAVAACGLAGGNDLPTSVLPFILRGVRLLGVDSVMAPQARRQAAWERIARELPLEKLDRMTSVEPMSELPRLAQDILAGRTRGRVVIDVQK